MDLLGSIMNSMEKPPVVMGENQRKLLKEQKAKQEALQAKEKEKIKTFRTEIEGKINSFIQDESLHKYSFPSMDKVFRALLHEIAEDAGLASFSFGQDERDRYVMLWKKEFAPSDDELLAYKTGQEWNEEKAKEMAADRARRKEKDEEEQRAAEAARTRQPTARLKYNMLAEGAVKVDAAKSYGLGVSSELKKDKRSIEETLNDIRAKKMQKTDDQHPASNDADKDT